MIKNLRELIEDLSVFDIKNYLTANGWSIMSKIQDKALEMSHNPTRAEVLLPLRKNLGDYYLRISELLETLSKVENRSMSSIYNDISLFAFDVIRLRILDNANNGSIPFLSNNEIINSSKEMLLAAASAVHSPKKLYGSRKTDEALEYLSKVRTGQTEVGSYILTILSPVPPKLSEQLLLFEGMEIDDDPIERKVTKTLFEGLNAAKEASIEASINNELKSFENAVLSGVSANLCESIANIVKKSGNTEISITWSKVRPNKSKNIKEKVFFDNKDADILTEAARYFKLTEPLTNQLITGWVYKLCQEQTDPRGTIYLKIILNEKPRTVKSVLSQEDYQKAMKAHGDKNTIKIEGELFNCGKILELKNPRNLSIEDQDE